MEELGLEGRRQLRELIQIDRAPARRLELPVLTPVRTGKAPLARSFPTPLSPRIKTVASVSATFSMTVTMARIWGLPSRSGLSLEGSTMGAARATAAGSRRAMRYKMVQGRFLVLFTIAHPRWVGAALARAQRAAWKANNLTSTRGRLRLRHAPLGIPGVETSDVKLNRLLAGEYGGNALHH